MDNQIWLHQQIKPITSPKQQTKVKQTQSTGQFKDLFQKTLDNVSDKQISFSNHAAKRMQERGINLTEVDMGKLENAISSAAAKGSRDALVLLNKTAYVVSVDNKTVVTAVDQNSAQNNIFTNIDSAIIL